MILHLTFPCTINEIFSDANRFGQLTEVLSWVMLHGTVHRYELDCLAILKDWFFGTGHPKQELPRIARAFFLRKTGDPYTIRVSAESESFSTLFVLKYPDIKVSAA